MLVVNIGAGALWIDSHLGGIALVAIAKGRGTFVAQDRVLEFNRHTIAMITGDSTHGMSIMRDVDRGIPRLRGDA